MTNVSEIRAKRNADFFEFVVDSLQSYIGTALTAMFVNSFNTITTIGLHIIFTVIQSYIIFIEGQHTHYYFIAYSFSIF